MPVGVPKVLYYWDDELPLQWIDLYNLIFRRRLVFVMSELDQDLCNQIAGMMVYIHFEDKRRELEKKNVQVVDLFEQTSNNLNSDTDTSRTPGASSKLTIQDLMDYDTIWDFEASVQKDYYLDIYNKLNENDNQYLESGRPKFPVLDQNSLKISSNNDENILKKYSNLLRSSWLPLLPVLSKYSNGRYFDLLTEFNWVQQNQASNLSSANRLAEISEFSNQSMNNMQSFFSKLAPELKFQNYLNDYQILSNVNLYNYLMDRQTAKENIKLSSLDNVKEPLRNIGIPNSNPDLQQSRSSLPNSGNALRRAESEDFLFSETQERMQEQRRVFVFINSTGGSVTSGITIYDALQFVKAGAVTVCLGMAFSASSMVLAGGNIGHRYVSEGGHIMCHQPEGGINGQASDVLLDAHEIMRVRRQAATIYTLSSKRAFHEVLKDLDRDYFMTPQEAIDYGLADEIVTRYNAECILDEFEKDWLAEDAKQIEGISKKIQQFSDNDEQTTAGADPRR